MGQISSIQRGRDQSLDSDPRPVIQLTPDNEARHDTPSRTHGRRSVPQPAHQTVDPHPSPLLATFSRQISAQSMPAQRRVTGNHGDISTRDEIFYEQHEERPLVHMEDLGMRDAPITHITASPMPRRSSGLARLSSLMVPRYAATGSLAEDQNLQREGRSLRRRLSNTLPSRGPSAENVHRSRRLSFLSSLAPRSHPNQRPSERRAHTSISQPIPLNSDAFPDSSDLATTLLRENAAAQSSIRISNNRSSRFWSLRDGSRLSRVRRSISSPFEAIIPQMQGGSSGESGLQTAPQSSRLALANDPDSLIPPLNITEPGISLDNSVSDGLAPGNWGQSLSGISTVSESPERALTRIDGPSWTERWAERGSITRRESRRMPNMLRGRSSRFIRRDNDGPLPRILHLAATAIAAQLSGSAEQPVPDMQALGPDDLDGSLQTLFRTLQNASNLGVETPDREGSNDPSRPSGVLPPLNFLRVFRFVSQSSSIEREGRTNDADRPLTEDASEDIEGRTVTLVVVGVRSVPAEARGHEDATLPEPNIDPLLNLPTVPPSANVFRNGASGFLRHANGRTRSFQRRRASVGGLTTFPANYDSQRHQRNPSSSNGNDSMSPTSTNNSSTLPILSDSPPGPHPPPSTPADPGISAQSSATTTPSRRPSSVSAIQRPPVSNRDIMSQPLRGESISAPDQQAFGVQQRRRSDSEFARHRDLGAGAARRNGVVEPDELENTDSSTSGSRSWLIYVVGTNLSEDHPALTTPSLFTDVSYSATLCNLLPLACYLSRKC